MSTPLSHFEETGAILEGHFRLSSGLHSNRYLQCAKVLMHPDRAEALCRTLAAEWDGVRPDVVIGPAIGGIAFAYEMARAFGRPGMFAERQDGAFGLRRGFEIEPGCKVLVAEDVVTTGGSVREVLALLEKLGAERLGVVSLVHRGDGNPFDVPFRSLLRVVPETWAPGACPLCADGIAAVKPGSRPENEEARG